MKHALEELAFYCEGDGCKFRLISCHIRYKTAKAPQTDTINQYLFDNKACLYASVVWFAYRKADGRSAFQAGSKGSNYSRFLTGRLSSAL